MKSGWGKALATGLIAAGLAVPSVAQDEEPEQLTGGLVLNGDVVFLQIIVTEVIAIPWPVSRGA